MSWIQKLYDTYNNCQTQIGHSGDDRERPLLPICHISAKAQIEITIDGNGNFLRARIILNQKDDATTIIPSTEGSASRAGSKPECHPLCDKLQYIAGDFLKYGGSVTSGFSKEPTESFQNYQKILSQWCQSNFAHPKAVAVLKYINRESVVKDLVDNKILLIGDNGYLVTKGEIKREKTAEDIFSVTNRQDTAFVRWVVESPGMLESKVWKDKTLYDSWSKYYLSTKSIEPLCYVTGVDAILTNNHPKYILREGNGAKIISSNDNQGFTFRGRFLSDDQVCNVSLDVSQKAHYALSWLISHQGYRSGEQAIVAWATTGQDLPKPLDDPLSILGLEELPSDSPTEVYTAQDVAIRLKKKIAGYRQALGDMTNIIVMGLDSATPGRLSITFYRELTSSDFLDRLNNWHETCSWQHTYRTVKVKTAVSGKTINSPIPFIGAPAPKDIAEAAYGLRIDDKLRSATVSRLLPCILDGQPIPRDLVESTYRQACNRMGKEYWEWHKTLTIACALYKKFNTKEKYDMSLDLNRTTRDYLYGRLLALAESLEEWALNTANEKRETNAGRLMQRFAERPYSTWRTIELALSPSKARLGGKATKRLKLLDEVIASFREDDFINDKRLSGEFLLGYHCQREFLRNAVDIKESSEVMIQTN